MTKEQKKGAELIVVDARILFAALAGPVYDPVDILSNRLLVGPEAQTHTSLAGLGTDPPVMIISSCLL